MSINISNLNPRIKNRIYKHIAAIQNKEASHDPLFDGIEDSLLSEWAKDAKRTNSLIFHILGIIEDVVADKAIEALETKNNTELSGLNAEKASSYVNGVMFLHNTIDRVFKELSLRDEIHNRKSELEQRIADVDNPFQGLHGGRVRRPLNMET